MFSVSAAAVARGLLGASLAAALLLRAVPALAFCKATTCDAASGDTCPVDANGCVTQGAPLTWGTGCLSFAVSQAGSTKRHIDHAVFDRIVRTAFEQWLAVDCGGGRHPSIALWDADDFAGSLLCDRPEYDDSGPNANGFILRDGDWPYRSPGAELAQTTLTFEPTTGRLLDADVEINSFGIELTTSDDAIVADLQSIVTHEAGHFLGLANSSNPDATMSATYSAASRKARSLSADDGAAICASYPPDRGVPACSDPSPNHGYSRYCAPSPRSSSCAVSPQRGSMGGASLVIVGLLLAGLRRSRRTDP